MRGYSGLVVSGLAAAAVVGLGSASPASSNAQAAANVIQARVSGLTIAGSPAKVRGRLPQGLRVRRVTLQRQRSPHATWRTIARTRVRNGRFVFRLRAPHMTGAIRLRVAAGPASSPAATSRTLALAVTQTRVLSPAHVVSAPPPGRAGDLLYSGGPKPTIGGFVALGVGRHTPDGLLAKVTGVSGAGGRWRVAVKPASLFDAVPVGHIRLGTAAAATGSVKSRRAASRLVHSGFALSCSRKASAHASGSASLSLTPSLDMSWGWDWLPPHPVLQSARFSLTASGSIKASASFDGSGSCSLKKDLFEHDFSPFDVQVGPIPVVIVPQLLATLTADAKASESISTALKAGVSATGGLSWDGNGISPIESFKKSFSFQTPSPQGKASIRARLIPAGRLLLYGLVGPEVDLSGGPQLDASVSSTSATWRLHVPIDVSAKLVIPHTDWKFGPLDVYKHDFTLAQGSAKAPTTQALFWANTPHDAIGRANLDGTGASQSFISGLDGPVGVALDANHIYWANRGDVHGTTIGRANLDGTGVNDSFIKGADSPVGVAVDGQHIYWSNSNNTIGRANLDGSGVKQSFITGVNAPAAVAVDGQHVYWGNAGNGTIGRANLDGTGVQQSFISGANLPDGLAVDGQHIYWTNGYAGTIGRANLDGTGVQQSFITLTGTTFPYGIAVDSGHVYWTDSYGNTIGRANLAGTGVDPSFVTGATSPGGVAVSRG